MQQTSAQSLTSLLSPAIKKHPLVNAALRTMSRISAAFHPGIEYDYMNRIVVRLLATQGVESSAEEVQRMQAELPTLFSPSQRLEYSTRQLLFYPLVRLLKPKVIVETGCAWGGSASFLLAALEKNGQGRLVSLDLPASEVSQAKFMGVAQGQIGALIPHELRAKWTLVEGDARIHLPKVLTEYDADLFIHDSLHTTTHQAFEYVTARSLMKDGALIASDDIRWNDAFRSFVSLHHLRGFAPLEDKNLGVAINRFDDYEKENGLYR